MPDPYAPPAWKGRAGLAVASAGLFAMAAALAIPVHGGNSPLRVDQAASRVVDSGRLARLVSITHVERLWHSGQMPVFLAFGLPMAAAGFALGVALFAGARGDWRAAVLSLTGPLLALLLTEMVAKPLVDRRSGGALAYPSGHATVAAAVAVLALVLLQRWGGWHALLVAGPLAVLVPVLTGLLLVRAGWHYPTDILGGTAVGAATVLALTAALGVLPGSPEPLRAT